MIKVYYDSEEKFHVQKDGEFYGGLSRSYREGRSICTMTHSFYMGFLGHNTLGNCSALRQLCPSINRKLYARVPCP